MENKTFWCEFLDLYRDLPALWRVKSDDYRNRSLKASAYEELVDKLRELYPEANREMVVKKINVFRSTYRKELKKVQSSQKSGAGSDDMYESSLWYFDRLSFLEDQEECHEESLVMENKSYENLPSRPKRKKISEEDNLIKLACEQLQSNQLANTDTDFLAKSWALQYKEMRGNQQLLARKIISDILFHGCLGTLNISHTVEIEQILLREYLNFLSTEQ